MTITAFSHVLFNPITLEFTVLKTVIEFRILLSLKKEKRIDSRVQTLQDSYFPA